MRSWFLLPRPTGSSRKFARRFRQHGSFKSQALVIHMSGAHSLDLLDSAKDAGARRAVLHPLQSVATSEQGIKTLPGSYFRVEADPEAMDTSREIVKALGGIELVMPKWSSDKQSAALYHAGAVAVSNYFVALVHYGLTFYESLGADREEALKAVLPLIRGTLHNIESARHTGRADRSDYAGRCPDRARPSCGNAASCTRRWSSSTKNSGARPLRLPGKKKVYPWCGGRVAATASKTGRNRCCSTRFGSGKQCCRRLLYQEVRKEIHRG